MDPGAPGSADRDNQAPAHAAVMFWHFLDVIWIGVFTFVYLMGAMR
jgi:cytochrome o ubiquinol oxidase subunit 3